MYSEKASATVALILRLSVAFFFAFHFYWKVAKGIDFTILSFEQRGFPFPTLFTLLDIGSEVFVIPFLVLGIYSRFCMIAMTPLMLGVIGVYLPRGMIFINSGIEFPLLWLICMLLLVIGGDGRFAIKVPHLAFDGRHPETWLRLGNRAQHRLA